MPGLALFISHIAKCLENSHVVKRTKLLLVTVAKALIFVHALNEFYMSRYCACCIYSS